MRKSLVGGVDRLKGEILGGEGHGTRAVLCARFSTRDQKTRKRRYATHDIFNAPNRGLKSTATLRASLSDASSADASTQPAEPNTPIPVGLRRNRHQGGKLLAGIATAKDAKAREGGETPAEMSPRIRLPSRSFAPLAVEIRSAAIGGWIWSDRWEPPSEPDHSSLARSNVQCGGEAGVD